jgi:hypothetical protein
MHIRRDLIGHWVSPFQGWGAFVPTQGVALGCQISRLWRCGGESEERTTRVKANDKLHVALL